MGRGSIGRCATGAVAIAAALLCGAHPAGAAAPQWVAAWSSPITDPGVAPADATVRNVARVTATGSAIRIRLANDRGMTPLRVGRAFAGRSTGGGGVVAGTNTQITFGGAAAITVPAGEHLLSDPVALAVRAGEDVAISLYLPDAQPPGNPGAAYSLSFVTGNQAGDHSADESSLMFLLPLLGTYDLGAIDVLSDEQSGTVVALGDSITYGAYSIPNEHGGWTDLLATRLQALAPGHRLALANAGIAGNAVSTDQSEERQAYGQSGVQRTPRDVLSQTGVRALLLLEGTNDLNRGCERPTGCTAPEIISALRSIVDAAHQACLPVIGGTLPPTVRAAAIKGTYDSPEQIAARHAVNDWIRGAGVYDAVLDFDAALRWDAVDPDRLNPRYDSGDHLHPSAEGHRVMAGMVDVALLQRLAETGCATPATKRAAPAPRIVRRCVAGGALRVTLRGADARSARLRLSGRTVRHRGRGWTVSARRVARAGAHRLRVRLTDGRVITRSVARC